MLKILVIQSKFYDFCQSSLIEGLHELSLQNKVKFYCTEQSNYSKVEGQYDHTLYDDNVAVKFGKDIADLIILCSNQEAKDGIAESIFRPDKTIFVDGEDFSKYRKNTEHFALYFKREMLLSLEHPSNVKPFPFAIENRYFFKSHDEILNNIKNKNIYLACMFGPHDETKPDRIWIENTLKNAKLENSVIGNMYDHKNKVAVDTGNRDHSNYYETLYNSKICVDGYGSLNCNAARMWEGFANGCFILTQPIKIYMPYSFIRGEHYLDFDDEDSLLEAVYNLDNDDYREKVATNCFKYVLENHTTIARVSYLLKECELAGVINE